MAFTVREFHDLVGLLEQHPEWRTELRRLVLTEELLSLPRMVRELVEAQQRTEDRMGRLEVQMGQLAEAQQRTEQRVAALAEAQQRTEQRVAALAEAQQRTEQQIGRLRGDVGDLKGMVLEDRYRQRAFAYFSRLVRKTHVVFGDELVTLLEGAIARGVLSDEGADEVARADVVVQGRRREDSAEVYLIVEVSWGVGPGDVERAVRRAALLAQTGLQTMPVVAGQSITAEAAELSRALQVWQVIDGRVTSPATA